MRATPPGAHRRPRPRRAALHSVLALATVVAVGGTGLAVLDLADASAATGPAVTADGLTVRASVSKRTVRAGASVRVTARVRSTATRPVIVDVEIRDGANARVLQRFWTRSLTAGGTSSLPTTFTVPASGTGRYRVSVGVFTTDWSRTIAWNDAAATISVSGTAPAPGTSAPATSTPASSTPVTSTPVTSAPTTTSTTGSVPASTGPSTAPATSSTSPAGTTGAPASTTGSSAGSPGTAPAGSPVARHGQLHVCGTALCDVHGARVQLKGVSSMWLNWETQPYAENQQALTWMRDSWNLSVIRAAMGVEPDGAYLTNPAKAKAQVTTIIDHAVASGVYVVVDFHAHEAFKEQAQAVAFFADLAKTYGGLPNVIWEDWNEPLQVSWSGVLKPYHQAVVAAIRASDPDNVIVLGTPTWSQQVDQAAADPVTGSNLMYALHFYSCTHGASLRATADAALKKGLPLFVTEWGATNADGGLDGQVCTGEAQAWIDWMKANDVSWTAWKLDQGNDGSNLLRQGAPVTGGWDAWLHGHAQFVRDSMKAA